MKRLEVNPSNEHYYTEDFISGFRCGTKRQFESDLAVLDKIKAELAQDSFMDVSGSKFVFVSRVNQIIDKYIGKEKKNEKMQKGN